MAHPSCFVSLSYSSRVGKLLITYSVLSISKLQTGRTWTLRLISRSCFACLQC